MPQLGGSAALAAAPATPVIGLTEIRAAAARIQGAVIRTPTLFSDAVSRATGTKVWLKLDNLQATGAFKERGAANRITPEQLVMLALAGFAALTLRSLEAEERGRLAGLLRHPGGLLRAAAGGRP